MLQGQVEEGKVTIPFSSSLVSTQYSPVDSIPLSQTCPECGSKSIVHNGQRKLKNKVKVQVYRCNDCHRKFSEKYLRSVSKVSQHQICAKTVKNLDSTTELKSVTSNDINGLKLQHHVELKLKGRADSTIRLSRSSLSTLEKAGATLLDPQSVRTIIAGKNWSGNRKRNVINAVTQFYSFIGLTWSPPDYQIVRKIPFIPVEQEIDELIAGAPNKIPTFLQLLKETAMRGGEAIQVRWKDVDLERRVVMCNYPEKGSNTRVFSDLSSKLLTMLNNLPRENEYIFGTMTLNCFKASFTRSRKRLAFKLANPRLNEIHFHTLRHWKATMLYHYTHDLLFVAEFLGHKDIENTRLYIQLEKNLFKNFSDENFTVKVVNSVDEAIALGKVGFQPYLVINGVQLVWKRN